MIRRCAVAVLSLGLAIGYSLECSRVEAAEPVTAAKGKSSMTVGFTPPPKPEAQQQHWDNRRPVIPNKSGYECKPDDFGGWSQICTKRK